MIDPIVMSSTRNSRLMPAEPQSWMSVGTAILRNNGWETRFLGGISDHVRPPHPERV